MLLFALKRALWSVPVLLVCVTLLFVLVHAIGGSPLRHGPPLGLSVAGPLLGQLVLGLFIVEWILAIPGIGRYFIAAAQTRDYPLMLGLTVVLTTCVVAANTVSDIALAAIDPRVREATSARSA